MVSQINASYDVDVKKLYDISKKYRVVEGLSKLKDYRKYPRIPLNKALSSLIFAPALGYNNLSDIDDFVEQPEARLLKIPDVSDSFLGYRVIPKIDANEIRKYVLYPLFEKIDAEGLTQIQLTNNVKPKVRVGHTDGSWWMCHFWVFFSVSGPVEFALDMQPANSIGDELTQAKILHKRLIDRFGEEFVDIITFDGKYIDYKYLNQLKAEYQIDFLVRIRGDDGRDLEVVQDIEYYIKASSMCDYFKESVKYEKVVLDAECSYEIYAIENLPVKGLDFTVTGAKIIKEYLKGEKKGQKEIHYVITSAEYLNLKDIIIIRKSHWDIEAMFDTLKNTFWSSHSYMAEQSSAETFGLLVLASYDLFSIYMWLEIVSVLGKERYRSLKLTLDKIRRKLSRSLIIWFVMRQKTFR